MNMGIIKDVLKLMAFGAIVIIGVRAAEWIIPAPETRVIVCMAEDMDKVDTCVDLKELVAKSDGKQ